MELIPVSPAEDVSNLSADACEVLLRIAAAYAASPCTADAVERLRPEFLCKAEQVLALEELLHAGMLELRQKVWGERLYQIAAQQYPWSCGASGQAVRRCGWKGQSGWSLPPVQS